MSDLDDIFNPPTEPSKEEAPAETKVEEEAEKAEPTEVVQEKEQPSETTAQKHEVKPKTDPEEDIEKEQWTFAAVKDERRKRQELERKLEELQKKETPSVFDDEKAFVDHLRQETRQELAMAKLNLARDMMMDVHEDYEQMETLFIEKVATENPILAEQARASTNPAKFIYQNAKKYLEYKDMQDVDSYKAKVEAEVRAKLEAEFKSKQEQEAASVSGIKPSLAKARASDKQEAVEEVTLESLFAR